ANGPKAVNYDVVLGVGTLQVVPAPLTLTPAEHTLTFGDALPEALWLPAAEGFKRAEDRDRVRFTVPGLDTPRPDAGDYRLAWALDERVPEAANYSIANPHSLRLTVAPRAVDVHLGNASTIYGEGAVVSIAGVDNFVPPLRSAGAEPRTLADWLAVHNPANPRTDAGEYQASVSSLSPNYELSSVSGGRIAVGRRHLAIKPSTRAVLYGDGFVPFAMVVAGLDGLA